MALRQNERALDFINFSIVSRVVDQGGPYHQELSLYC